MNFKSKMYFCLDFISDLNEFLEHISNSSNDYCIIMSVGGISTIFGSAR